MRNFRERSFWDCPKRGTINTLSVDLGGVRRPEGSKSIVPVLRNATPQAPPTLFEQSLYARG